MEKCLIKWNLLIIFPYQGNLRKNGHNCLGGEGGFSTLWCAPPKTTTFFDVAPYPSLASRQTLDLVVRVQKTVSIYPCKAHTAHLSVLLMGDLTGSIHLLLPPLVCV